MTSLRVTGWGAVTVALVACSGASTSVGLSGGDGGGTDEGGASSGGSEGGGASSSGGTGSSGGSSGGGSGGSSGTSSGTSNGAGSSGSSSGSSSSGAPVDASTDASTDGGAACAGMDCGGWTAALSAASSLNGAAGSTPDQALANCVIQLHRSDCCGARHAYGFNHAARTQLCAAESACTYPTSPGCSNATITTDTGETTTDPSQVRLRVVNPTSCTYGTCYTCETFVCTAGSCATAPGIMPTQCGPVDSGTAGG